MPNTPELKLEYVVCPDCRGTGGHADVIRGIPGLEPDPKCTIYYPCQRCLGAGTVTLGVQS